MELTKRRCLTLLIAVIGAGVFFFLGLPLPLLLGPLLACLITALIKVPLADFGWLSQFMRTFLGVAVGSAVRPETLESLPSIAYSLAFIPVYIVALGTAGFLLFRYVFGFDKATSFYAGMPGGLPDMLLFGADAGADVRALSLIHATRVLVVVAVAPFIITFVWGIDLLSPPGQPITDVDPFQVTLMVLCGLLGWRFAVRVRLFGAPILGPMILTAVLSLLGIITERPPAEMIFAAQFFVGISVGFRYLGVSFQEVKRDVGAGVIYSLLAAFISAGFFFGVSALGFAPLLDAILAFLPGGQAEMVVIAIIAGADLSYVVGHHVLRLVMVILLAPVFARLTKA